MDNTPMDLKKDPEADKTADDLSVIRSFRDEHQEEQKEKVFELANYSVRRS